MTAVPEGLATIGDRISLRERVAVSLRAALVSGRMVPGTTYSIPVLAEQFGVSATPVREAMLDLVSEGIMMAVPNKGFRVVALSDTDLDEITELRRLLEVPTVVSVAGRLDRKTIAHLRRLEKEVHVAAASGDVVAYIEADRELHLTLLGAAGNPRLVDMVGRLRDQSRLYGLEQLAAEGVLVRSADEHRDLIDAIVSGDAASAQAIMEHHLGHVRGLWARGQEEQT